MTDQDQFAHNEVLVGCHRVDLTVVLSYKFNNSGLAHFKWMFPFYTPWKHQETIGFLVFSGGIKWNIFQK